MTSPTDIPIYRVEHRVDLAAIARLEQLAQEPKG